MKKAPSKYPRATLGLLAGGIPLCLLALLPNTHGIGLAGVQETIAQTSPAAVSPQFPTFGGRRPLMDYLRWQALAPAERDAQTQTAQEEWSRLIEFLQHNCPNRYLLLLRQSPKPNSPLHLRLLLRWQNMLQLQRTQPQLYQVHVDQFKQEDVIIGLAAQLRQARNRNEPERVAEIRDQIQVEAAKLIDLNLEQRRLTIENAQHLLSQEQANFQRDLQNKTDISQKRAMQMLQQIDRGISPRGNFTPGDQ